MTACIALVSAVQNGLRRKLAPQCGPQRYRGDLVGVVAEPAVYADDVAEGTWREDALQQRPASGVPSPICTLR